MAPGLAPTALPLTKERNTAAFSMPSKKNIHFPVPCSYCGVALEEANHTWDHIVPRSAGGTNDPGNLTHACEPCNKLKGRKPLTEFLALIGRKGYLFSVSHKPETKYQTRVQNRVSKLIIENDLVGEIDYATEGGPTYTPPQGCGVSKLLRQVLKAKGIKVKWLPLPAAPSPKGVAETRHTF